MKNERYIFNLSMTLAIVMLFFSYTEAQNSFNADSLKEVFKSDLSQMDKVDALSVLANSFLDNSIYDSAIHYCGIAISIAEDLDNERKQAELNTMMGKLQFYGTGQPAPALEFYKEGFDLAARVNDSSIMAKALNGMGVMYMKLGYHYSALNCYIQLVSIAERKGYEKTLGMGYVNMGILYQYENDFEKANHYLDLSIPINTKYRIDLVALAKMNKGLIFFMLDDNDSSLIMYRQALNIYQEYGNPKNLADLYNNMGNTFTGQFELDSADFYFNKALDITVEREDWYTFCQVYHNLALNYYRRGNYQKTLEMLDSCLIIARNTGNAPLERKANWSKHIVHHALGNYEKALKYYWKYDTLDQLIFSKENAKLMADLEMKYQNEKMRAENIALERDNLIISKRNNIYLFTGLGIIVLIIFAFLFFRQRAVKDRIIAQQRIQQLEEEKKLLAAKSLVEGQEEERKRIAREIHDGLGVLLSTTKMQFSTIIETSPEIRPIVEKASRLLEQASNDARKISHNMMPGLLTKLGLYEAVEDLFEKLSDTESLKVHVDIPEDMIRLPENNEIMVYRIIQELVNNTLKHAEAKNIRLCMQVKEAQLDIGYSDDGKGFDYEEKLDSKSIGLTSIQSRVNFLNAKMQVKSAPGEGATFRFLIPYSKE